MVNSVRRRPGNYAIQPSTLPLAMYQASSRNSLLTILTLIAFMACGFGLVAPAAAAPGIVWQEETEEAQPQQEES